ncbi:uncharacterized protein J3D65DRAFT_642672 [Phyllosticta citribraziliensis]|uniref:Secreted protein n=1 Tax=Phyllosticta citribraziliensis TaxID=989973 RepID=A0ABR1L344_9PEZI
MSCWVGRRVGGMLQFLLYTIASLSLVLRTNGLFSSFSLARSVCVGRLLTSLHQSLVFIYLRVCVCVPTYMSFSRAYLSICLV